MRISSLAIGTATSCRLYSYFFQNEYVHFGRVLVMPDFRGKGYAQTLLRSTLAFIQQQFPNYPIEIQAQHYLQEFYQKYSVLLWFQISIWKTISHILICVNFDGILLPSIINQTFFPPQYQPILLEQRHWAYLVLNEFVRFENADVIDPPPHMLLFQSMQMIGY